MQKVTDNVYVESETSICNTSIVVTKDGVVVIDTPMVPANAKKLAADISRFGPVRYVINSEPHGDHIAGNCYFGGMVVTHDGTRKALLAAKPGDITGMLQMMSPDSLPLDKEFHFRPSDITFSERLTLYLGAHSFHLIHMPGHTPYSLAVYVTEERIVFTSDNVNLGMPVFRDSIPDKWLETLQLLEELDVDKVVPGHGEVTDKSCFSKMSRIVRSWIDIVADAIASGMSLEETLEKVPQAEMFANMPKEGPGAGFLRMNIEKLYRTLKK
jgi:cyclase